MFKIISKEELAPQVKKIEVKAYDIANRAKAGQFVMLRIDSNGERIPLTIADKNIDTGVITIIFQEVGKTTEKLGKLGVGDSILDLAGPLGRASEIKNYGSVIAVDGGVGIAELYPVVKELKAVNNKICVIVGARSKELLILEKELKGLSDELKISTDDGTYGLKGFVTDILKAEISTNRKIDLIYAIGPVQMMKAVASIAKPHKIKTIVSLNSIMVDGTGMCGSCRVKVGRESKFACVHGPEFEAGEIDFDELQRRLDLFKESEKKAREGL